MPGYTYIWAFVVREDSRQQFEEHYGPSGTWAQLFRMSDEYIETLLLQDKNDPCRYVTIDRWRSHGAYKAFRTGFADDYARLDRQCGSLTTHEQALGEYVEE
jgi:heme-degrading monooxygenase HmoA